MRRFIRLALVSVLVVLAVTSALADEVFLKNGDRLTGDIVKMDDETLTLKTGYGGNVKIDRKEIQGVTSSGPHDVRLKDGSTLRGSLRSPSPNPSGTSATTATRRQGGKRQTIPTFSASVFS